MADSRSETVKGHTPARVAVAQLVRQGRMKVDFRPGRDAIEKMSTHLGLRGLRKPSLVGEVVPDSSGGWRLEARMGATVVQDCVVTLEPVTTRLEEAVVRRYLSDIQVPDPEAAEEVEIPDDDTIEPLGHDIDLSAVLEESIALALPPYPHAQGVGHGDAAAGPSGAETPENPSDRTDENPFAALAKLRDRLDPPD